MLLKTVLNLLGLSLLAGATGLAWGLEAEGAIRSGGGHISKTDQAYWVEQITDGLNFPSAMTWLSNTEMLITERMGGLRLLRDGKLQPRSIGGMPGSFQSSALDGVKDIVLDPDFRTNRTIYLLISEGTVERRHAAIYRAQYDPSGLMSVERIFRSKDEIGGVVRAIASRMVFLNDKTLLAAIPDDGEEHAQRLDSHLGKILRINRDGSVPHDNPFLNTPGALPEIWSFGHRVPLGLYHDAATGTIWEVESGPRGGDELNILKAGANYGWAKASWGFEYSGGLVAPMQFGSGIEDPILVWTPSVTPSGLIQYRGSRYPLWREDLFMGHLTGKALERVRIAGSRVVLQENLLIELEERIRDVKEGPDGYIYLLTDHQNGRLLRLRAGKPAAYQLSRLARRLEQHFEVPDVAISDEDLGDPEQGKQSFLRRCASCHSVGVSVLGGDIGPDLGGVFGRRAGSKEGFGYSRNMTMATFRWDVARLDSFLNNPNSLVPENRMAAPAVTDAKERLQIISFLKNQSLR